MQYTYNGFWNYTAGIFTLNTVIMYIPYYTNDTIYTFLNKYYFRNYLYHRNVNTLEKKKNQREREE